MDGLTDEQLMEHLIQGETLALDELYTRYARMLYAFCHRTTRSADPQDLVQDVFERVIKAAHTFDPHKASFRTWMFRIARNHCIDTGRRAKRFTFVSLWKRSGVEANDEEVAPRDALVDQNESVEGSVVRMTIVEAVRDCIAGLENEDERQAILLYYLGSKVYREIGEILGKSTSMARNYVKMAQDNVRRCLERKGISSAF